MITVIANLKGGCGKSTVAFNLGLWLQMKGEPVVAFDLDPQRTLLDVSQVRREEGWTPPLLVFGGADSLADYTRGHSGEIIIDVGASNLSGMHEALTLSDRVIVPVSPSQPDLWATQRFLKIARDAMSDDGHTLDFLLFVNRADTHSAVRESDETEEALYQLPEVRVLTTRLCQRTIYRRSLSEGLSVFELERYGKAAGEFEAFASALYPKVSARAGSKINRETAR